MEISAKAVMDLRKKTGVSMMACKKALMEAEGNEEQAIEILRKSGEAKALKKADRETSEGAVYGEIRDGKGVLVKIGCETDFVARNEAFEELAKKMIDLAFEKGAEAMKDEADALAKDAVVTLGENIQFAGAKELEGETLAIYMHSNKKTAAIVALSGGSEDLGKDFAMHVVASQPVVVSPDEVPEELVEKEKEIWREQLIEEGKPEAMLDQIMAGKVKKFKEQQALLTQEFVKDPSQKVEQVAGDAKVTGFIHLAI